ncbi:hypothetical protein Hypma_001774 [Hypsizygus marmoreus]|uniref:Uncharacterized protein n=1 Tax=Hypsizygus marmoreus TaxID=39966 RepID=A0A369J8X1_HYPMA|nr:hypothetical protein Hypma_001774 [Hypsizygus marmoreus]
MERSIGNLTEEIKQDSTPYANLSRRAVERAELNALKAMVPGLDKDVAKDGAIPRGGIGLGNGYVLLRAMDSCARDIEAEEEDALIEFLQQDVACLPGSIPLRWKPRIVRWSRLRLPNGQVARSVWKEDRKARENLRSARNVKLQYKQRLEFGEVQYYFRFDITSEVTRTLAMVSLYSHPDLGLLRESSNTLWSCRHQGVAGLVVMEVKCIEAVVAMAPHSVAILGQEWNGRVFVVEKPGLDVAEMGGVFEDVPDDE